MSAGRSTIPELDRLFPFRGPCAMCGGVDARHRLWDNVAENVRAGDSVEFVASGYGLTVEQVEAVVAHWHGKRLRKAVHA